jgi:hypothetical protein
MVNQTLTSIAVSPSSASVAANGSMQFSATGFDQFDQLVSQAGFIWSVSSGGGSIDSFGYYTASATPGTYMVTATSGGLPGTASVTVTALSSGSASFLNNDAATQGSWATAYGGDGYDISQGAISLPSYATVNIAGNYNYVWNGSTSDSRALVNPGNSGRLAACWYTPSVSASSSFTIDVSLSDGNSHQVALYALDWDNYGPRSERIDVLDAGTGTVLDSQTVSSFAGGQYLVWNVAGHVQFRITNLVNGSNAVISGLFFGTGSTSSNETVWVEDSVPAGATQASDGGDAWTWVNSGPTPYSGSVASQSNIAAGEHQHYFYNATSTLAVATGDKLFAYVYLDPANSPSEIMLQWHDDVGGWEHRAYWGANNIGWGVDGTVSRHYMGSLPAAGGWVRLEVPASAVGLESATVDGMAFTLYDGRATWDKAGKADSTASAPSIASGSFETPDVGTGSWGAFQYNPSGTPWTFSGGAGVAGNGSGFTSGNPDAPDGTQVAFLQGTGSMSQAVNFAAGSYTLSFYAAQRGNYQASYQSFQVLIDGQPIGNPITPTGTNYNLYMTSSFNVTAGMHTVTFQGLNPNGGDNTAFIDQIHLN